MRIAILGCGSIGYRHLKNLQTLGYTDLIAFDPMQSARDRVESELGITCFFDIDDLWAVKPDVALVTAPSNLHLELAKAAVRNRCHLFIEKPLSHSMTGWDELLKEIGERELITMVGCNMRFHTGLLILKSLIDRRAVGQVIAARIQSSSYLPEWRPWQDYRQSYSASPEWGGAILDCIHEIDLALWYFGAASVIGAARLPARTIGLETDGLAEAILCHESGVLSNLHLSFVQRDYRRNCQIIASEGTIYWDWGDRQVKVYGSDGRLAEVLPEPDGWTKNQMYIDELTHFLESVQNRTPTINPISGGLAALEIALAIRKPNLLTN